MDKVFAQAVGQIVGRNLGATLTPELVDGLVRSIMREFFTVIPEPPAPRHLADEMCGANFSADYEFAPFAMDEHLDELKTLHALHWEETEGYRNHVELAPDYEAFRRDEALGHMVFFGVFDADYKLVGNCAMYVTPSRHNGELVATEDTLYLRPDARVPGLAKAFVAYMEGQLRVVDVAEVRVDSKTANHADRFMRLCGYKPVATRLVKRLKEAENVQ